MRDRDRTQRAVVSLTGAIFTVALGCAANQGGHGGQGDDDDDVPPTDACACPDGGGGGSDGGGGGSDGGGGGCQVSNPNGTMPFGSHAVAYAAGAIVPDHQTRDQLDDAVRDYYDTWKSRYLKTGCGAGRYYIATGQSGRITVSEGHGYGMLILAFMAGHDPQARAEFDGMYQFYAEHPSDIEPTLMAWSQDSACHSNDGVNSATDGDLDIAYALLLADKQWGSSGTIDYRAKALAIINGIKSGETDAGHNYVRLGDWTSPGEAAFYNATRTSDFMPAHLASFAAATGDSSWTHLRDQTYVIISALQGGFASQTGLLPDFVLSPTSNPRPAGGNFLEGANDGQYSYNACRDPWRIAVDFLVHGDARSKTAAQKLNTWIKSTTGGNPANIKAGYRLDGGAIGNYLDMSFVAPFGVAAMVDASNQAWLDQVWDLTLDQPNGDYYGDTLSLLSLIAMSGNWWSPEAAPCP